MFGFGKCFFTEWRYIFIYACMVFLISPGTVMAQDDTGYEDELSFYELEEQLMVSVASFIKTDLLKQPATVTVVTADQLRLSGSRLLSEALMMYVPGIFVIEDQDDLITGFRGLGPDMNPKIMVLLNGTNMNIEWFWGAPPNLINTINFDWIERVEVIRGPGSVAYGQGALMGVINIVTRDGSYDQARATVRAGKDNDFRTSYEYGSTSEHADYYLYISKAEYDGQDMKAEGWGLRPYGGAAGGTIADQNPKIRNGENVTALATVTHKKSGIRLNAYYFDQTNDVYNFWVDRNVLQHRLMAVDIEHSYDITDRLKIVSSVSHMRDDYRVAINTTGMTTGGTREDRTGIKSRLHINEAFTEGNNLVFGADFRNIEGGKLNNHGDNYLLDILNSDTLDTYTQSNELRTYLNRSTTDVLGIFLEDFYDINDRYSLFGALRYDYHPNWGSHLSYRFGAIGTPAEGTDIRFTYQNGFRGAVGLTYSGGFKLNGFIDADNFDKIDAAGITGFSNLPEIEPEEIDSFELALNQRIGKSFNLNIVGFYNIINHVIDFAAILPKNWPNHTETFPNIGDVPPGEWGGFWHFKNNEGKIHLGGLEGALRFDSEKLMINLSHSFVSVISAEDDHESGSMYVTASERVKVFPEHVTRLNMIYRLFPETRVALNYLYYYDWISPLDREIESNHMLNLSVEHKFPFDLTLRATVKNLLNDDKMYPMNNVVGANIIDGTPAYEERTFWVELEYNF